MRLNIGAGKRRIAGYTGVDAVSREAADIVAPANAIPLPDGCADEVLAVHLVEHILPWEVPGTLAEWGRLLKPGGLLVVELPDVVKCCRNIVAGFTKPGKHPDQLGMWGLYGDNRDEDPWMLHRWGWTFKSLAPLVASACFTNIVERQTKYHSIGRDVRDFRLEARKA